MVRTVAPSAFSRNDLLSQALKFFDSLFENFFRNRASVFQAVVFMLIGVVLGPGWGLATAVALL